MRRWLALSVLALPFTVACASVLGLEEAELDEEGGNGGSCEYDAADVGDECVADCWNDACCDAASACFDDPDGRCGDYLTCTSACPEGDTACRTRCANTHPGGAALSRALTACTLTCDCVIGGGTGTECTSADPATCEGTDSVELCVDGTYEVQTCASVCDGIGLDVGPCEDDGCQCGPPLDAECFDGMQGYCFCSEDAGDAPCTPAIRLGLYVGCYTAEVSIEPTLRCVAQYVDGTSVDCDGAAVCLEAGPSAPP